jgi:hypothetical protein
VRGLVEHDPRVERPWPELPAEVIGRMSLKRLSANLSETPSPTGAVAAVRLADRDGADLAARGDALEDPLRQAVVEDPPAADVVDRVSFLLPVDQRVGSGLEQRLGDVDAEVDPGVADLSALQVDAASRADAVDDEPLPAPRLLAASAVRRPIPALAAQRDPVGVDPDLALLERLAQVLEREGVARAAVDRGHERHQELDVPLTKMPSPVALAFVKLELRLDERKLALCHQSPTALR